MESLNPILTGIVGTLISIGILALISGQKTIKKEAKEGRAALHEKIDKRAEKTDKEMEDHSHRITTLEAHHRQNHPGQL
jgi:hypothetical protein